MLVVHNLHQHLPLPQFQHQHLFQFQHLSLSLHQHLRRLLCLQHAQEDHLLSALVNVHQQLMLIALHLARQTVQVFLK